MAYLLTADLLTGNKSIDAQHQQLFDALNRLMDACAQGKGRAQIDETLKFLVDYVDRHFADEEKLQIAAKYPDYNQHHLYHETYKKTVREIAAEVSREGPTVTMVGKLNSAIAGWLINHIKREDVKMAAYLRSHS